MWGAYEHRTLNTLTGSSCPGPCAFHCTPRLCGSLQVPSLLGTCQEWREARISSSLQDTLEVFPSGQLGRTLSTCWARRREGGRESPIR